MDDFLNSSTSHIHCELRMLKKLFGVMMAKTQQHEDYARYSQNKTLEKLEERLFKIEYLKGRGRARYLYNTFKARLKKAEKEGRKEMIIYENRLNILVNFADDTCNSWNDFLLKHDESHKNLPKQSEKTPAKVSSTFSQTYGNFLVRYVYLS